MIILNIKLLIVKEFEIRFDEVFLNTQTKAHLDVCLQIIDGAKG